MKDALTIGEQAAERAVTELQKAWLGVYGDTEYYKDAIASITPPSSIILYFNGDGSPVGYSATGFGPDNENVYVHVRGKTIVIGTQEWPKPDGTRPIHLKRVVGGYAMERGR